MTIDDQARPSSSTNRDEDLTYQRQENNANRNLHLNQSSDCQSRSRSRSRNSRSSDNPREESQDDDLLPPDGGTRAWLVMISSFLCIGLLFGLINSYGVIHSYLQKRLSARGDPEASSKAALIGSLNFGMTLLFSPVAGILSDAIGLAFTTLIGAVICVLALLLSSVVTYHITALFFTYGFLLGFGASLVYTPTLAILGLYFKRHLGKVNGFVSSGASIFTVIAPPTLTYILWRHDLSTALRVLAVIFCFLIVAAFVYSPMKCRALDAGSDGTLTTRTRRQFACNADIWKNRPYTTWILCCAIALSGYYVPYVHMAKFVDVRFPRMSNSLPIMCIGATSGIGRVFVGVLADVPSISRIRLHQIALIGMGCISILLPLIWSYDLLICLTLLMGLFDGFFFPVLCPIAYELCGADGATQAIGFFLGLVAIPLTIGPVVAGKIFDETQSYMLPFILAGIPSIVGALCMSFVKKPKEEVIVETEPVVVRPTDQGSGDKKESLSDQLQKLDAALQHQKSLQRSSSSSNLLYQDITSEIDIEINNDRVYNQKQTTKRKYKYSIF